MNEYKVHLVTATFQTHNFIEILSFLFVMRIRSVEPLMVFGISEYFLEISVPYKANYFVLPLIL
jgi:hypothetical protein